MAFKFLENRLSKSIKNVTKRSILSEENISEVLSEIRLVLLEADVNLKVVNNFVTEVKEKIIGNVVDYDKTSSQKILEAINQELIKVLGKTTSEWKHSKPTIVMMVGLQGSGKTTSTAKIALHLTKRKKQYSNPLLVGLDVYRPAAIDQLEKLANDLSYDFYSEKNTKDVEAILIAALEKGKANNNDLIILDTAGRLQTNTVLMDELKQIKKIAKPQETIFVIDAMAGQEIINVAEEFNTNIKLTSTIVTKLDSDAKGGAVLSIASILGIPIKFIGTGEKITELSVFHPDRMASRLLGLGDIKTLVEKGQEFTDEKRTEQMIRKIITGTFDLSDLIYSMDSMSKMGSMGSVSSMIPGMKITESQTMSADRKMVVWKILTNSMTKKELKTPKLLNHPKRKNRIIKGSGRTPQEYNELIRQFERSSKQMKAFAKIIKSGKMPNINNLGSMMGGNNFGGTK